MRILLILFALLAPAAAQAANSVSLASTVFVEKTIADANGRNRVILEEPKVVTPGDRLVFILAYRNIGGVPASDFVITNPLPQAVSYQGTSDGSAQVSVDGGRSWGSLAALKVQEVDGRWRSAQADDVTHVRWAMKRAIPAGAQGKFSFRGIVR
jgi:uncharacterized repeat protein (TIGR01451 family)